MKKTITIQDQTFSATELKSQIERQYTALYSGRWGWETLSDINAAIGQAEEELCSVSGRCPKSKTLKLAYEILRDGKLHIA